MTEDQLHAEIEEANAEIGRLTKENERLKEIARDLQWMARRYADGRMTFAPSTVNRHTRTLLEMGVPLLKDDGTYFARDGMGRRFDGLTDGAVGEIGMSIEHGAADQIRRLMEDDGRFAGLSGATALRRADPKRGWTEAGYFSFTLAGRPYFVTVEAATKEK